MEYKNKLVAKSLTEMGFEEFTEIQTKTIPLIEAGNDIIGHSQTGTGKTAAFTLPFLERIDYSNPHVQALVVCPTRELAVQVKGEINRIGKYLPDLKTIAIFGGESIGKQIKALKFKPQIVIGTPGRLIDHIKRKLVRLKHLNYLVLDEADEMMKMGFKEDIETIIENCNPNHQTVMFSATMPKQIVHITKKYMNDPELVSVISKEETNQDITQYYYTVQERHKAEAVGRLLHVYNPKLTLIFCNTKRKVDNVTRELTKKGYNVNKIHGDLNQSARLSVLDSFHQGELDILVATDVAARGLDIKNVEVVINYDVPEKAEFYVHRIGRTGRIGNKGYAFMMVSKKEMYRIKDIEKFIRQSIKKRNIPTPEKVLLVKQEQQIEEFETIINTINMSPYAETAYQLLYKHDAMHVVSALLHKLDKSDTSQATNNDLNANYSHKNNQNNSNNQQQNDGETRYHFNVGGSDGLNPKTLVETIMKKTRLKNGQINDVSMSQNSSFFSAPSQKHNQIMKSLTNIKMQGKKTSVQVANTKSKPKKSRRRRRR